MLASEIRDMNEAEIRQHIANAKQELFNLRLQGATRQLKNHSRFQVVRRDIARLLTVLREREIEAIYAAEIAELQALMGEVATA
jgi:large subunit ribosomal protein L29